MLQLCKEGTGELVTVFCLTSNLRQYDIPPLKLTARPWKPRGLEDKAFPFFDSVYFQGWTVSFRECSCGWQWFWMFFSYSAYLIFQDILVILYTPWKFSSKSPWNLSIPTSFGDKLRENLCNPLRVESLSGLAGEWGSDLGLGTLLLMGPWNPVNSPVEGTVVEIPLFTGFYTSQVVSRISEPSTVSTLLFPVWGLENRSTAEKAWGVP